VEAWIETTATKLETYPWRSPPAWRRGLKHVHPEDSANEPKSPPAWRRGLKQLVVRTVADEDLVASRVEAWIETLSPQYLSHP